MYQKRWGTILFLMNIIPGMLISVLKPMDIRKQLQAHFYSVNVKNGVNELTINSIKFRELDARHWTGVITEEVSYVGVDQSLRIINSKGMKVKSLWLVAGEKKGYVNVNRFETEKRN